MNDSEAIDIAKKFLKMKHIEYVPPGEIGESNNKEKEVIFLHPLAVGPDVIMDPPDIRVLVNKRTKKATLIMQM